MTRVCFVCTGNICRSPMAEVVAASMAADAGLDGVAFDSAGTGGWHAGDRMDRRAAAALRRRGYDPDRHRARQWRPSWEAERDLVVLAGAEHARDLHLRLSPTGDGEGAGAAPAAAPVVRLLSSYAPADAGVPRDIPDPYFGDDGDFDACLDLIETCARGLVAGLAGGAGRCARA